MRVAELSFRYAKREDAGLVLQFITELATYEHIENEVTTNEKTLEEWMFDRQCAQVLFALEDGREAGFAIFFYNFSSFLGRAGLYLEDLFVRPEFRGRGYGKALLRQLARIAAEKGCGRMEWCCLDWNQPSIDFYRSLGAKPMDSWTLYRLEGDTLEKLAK
ncbi:MAG: GNAT family N-acetyltransferase [Provencibacterium sp.]|jgi:GNAT superfamily N-acetyltransferase|nr:GNAT family N-acetyltransferase [Provencibacterium sp.]